MYQLPATPVEDDLPLPCAPGIRSCGDATPGAGAPITSRDGTGILGSADVQWQSSRECAGECPSGSQCPEPATHIPFPCAAGAFCPAGTIVPQPCPDGTYSNSTSLAAAEQCLQCPAGSYCAAGALEPVPCAAGFFGSVGGATSSTCEGARSRHAHQMPSPSAHGIQEPVHASHIPAPRARLLQACAPPASTAFPARRSPTPPHAPSGRTMHTREAPANATRAPCVPWATTALSALLRPPPVPRRLSRAPPESASVLSQTAPARSANTRPPLGASARSCVH